MKEEENINTKEEAAGEEVVEETIGTIRRSDATITGGGVENEKQQQQQQHGDVDVERLITPSPIVSSSSPTTTHTSNSEKAGISASTAGASILPGAVAVSGPSAAAATQNQQQQQQQAEDRVDETAAAITSGGTTTTHGQSNGETEPIIEQAALEELRGGGKADDSTGRTVNNTVSAAASVPMIQVQREEEPAAPARSSSSSSTVLPTVTIPVALEYQEPPLIAAEIVPPRPPPTTAVPVYQVDIDAEDLEQPAIMPSAAGKNSSTNHDKDQQDHKEMTWMDRPFQCNRRRWGIGGLLILGLVALIIVIALLVPTRSSNEDDPSPVATFSYPCYTSTLDLLTAQIEARQNNVTLENIPLIICPNTTISIGTFRNPQRDDFNFTDGDYPINVIGPNITIQCGLDGKRENNCVLEGGLSHVVTQRASYHPTYGFVDTEASTDGLTLRGITFTGKFESSGPFGGISVAISHPGKGMRFEDCAWIRLTATKRVLTVGQNFLMELLGIGVADQSMDLTLSNCLFDDVGYEEEFMASFQQSIHLEHSTFRNVQLARLLSAGCGLHPEGCRNLLFCRGASNCSMSHCCIDRFDAAGAAPIVISHETEWLSDGNTWNGPLEYGGEIEVPNSTLVADSIPQYEPGAVSSQQPNNDAPVDDMLLSNETINEWVDGEPFPYCALGVARVDTNGRTYQCLDEPVFELSTTTTGECPMIA